MEFVVCNAPSQHSVKQNVVYLANPVPTKYLTVVSKSISYVFNQKQCDDFSEGHIGINAVQRRSLKISCGEKLTAKPFTAGVTAALVIAVMLECKSLGSDLHIKVQDLSSHVARTYQDQIWTTCQSLAIDVMGHIVILTKKCLRILPHLWCTL